jgi:hypothetical protein
MLLLGKLNPNNAIMSNGITPTCEKEKSKKALSVAGNDK